MVKKKLYHKPEIKQVKLVPEEAVLTGCKISLGVGAGKGGTCKITGAPSGRCLSAYGS